MVKLMKNEKREVKEDKFWYVFGSVVVTVGVMLVLPKIIEKGAKYFYEKKNLKH